MGRSVIDIDRSLMRMCSILSTTMALQPNMHILNQSAQTFATELSKFSNIPAIAEGNAILDAIADLSNRITALGDRITTDINNSANQQITRLRAT